jgi:hypothetical protein
MDRFLRRHHHCYLSHNWSLLPCMIWYDRRIESISSLPSESLTSFLSSYTIASLQWQYQRSTVDVVALILGQKGFAAFPKWKRLAKLTSLGEMSSRSMLLPVFDTSTIATIFHPTTMCILHQFLHMSYVQNMTERNRTITILRGNSTQYCGILQPPGHVNDSIRSCPIRTRNLVAEAMQSLRQRQERHRRRRHTELSEQSHR